MVVLSFWLTVILQTKNGYIALTAVSPQKLRCRLFRPPIDKIVPLVTIHRYVNFDIVLYVTGVLIRCLSKAFVLA